MEDEKVLRLVQRINSYMISEQQALKDDDPAGTCAAHHRGAISACGFFLKYIQELMYEDKNTKIKK